MRWKEKEGRRRVATLLRESAPSTARACTHPRLLIVSERSGATRTRGIRAVGRERSRFQKVQSRSVRGGRRGLARRAEKQALLGKGRKVKQSEGYTQLFARPSAEQSGSKRRPGVPFAERRPQPGAERTDREQKRRLINDRSTRRSSVRSAIEGRAA